MFFFFFQAEDGIRDGTVTGVQTCALPIFAGHEYAEAVTDPGNQSGIQDGWNDATGSENADKCAWTNLQNITLAGQTYASQPMWSNEANAGAGGCAYTR